MRAKNLQACKSIRRKTSWAVDYDYISKLSDEELQFLADFTNFFYHGSPHRCTLIHMSKELISESYRRNNTSERDIYTKISKKELKKQLLIALESDNNQNSNHKNEE